MTAANQEKNGGQIWRAKTKHGLHKKKSYATHGCI